MSDSRGDSQVDPQVDSLGEVLATLEAQRRAERAVMSTSADRVARTLRTQIADGHLRPGTRLPEERLGAALGVSRNTLREALSMLVAERLLARQPHRGVVVATPAAVDVDDVYAARAVLEPGSLLLGLTEGRDLSGLRAAVERGRGALESGDPVGLADANHAFHRAVVALAGSDRLDAEMDRLLAEMRLVFHVMGDLVGGVDLFHAPYVEQNDRICRLAERGRGREAAEALETYLQAARRDLTAAVSAPSEEAPGARRAPSDG